MAVRILKYKVKEINRQNDDREQENAGKLLGVANQNFQLKSMFF